MVMDGVPFPIARRRTLDAFEKRYVQTVLDMHGGNVVRASGASGIALRYFQVVKARSNRA
jgi:two-component system, NtrC family, response regulator HydG